MPEKPVSFSCPIPKSEPDIVVMAHGGGGRQTQRLIERCFRPAFQNSILDTAHDGAILPGMAGKLAMTTDGFVVRPRFFPGGDLGCLAVFGTVNDLAMCGARPLFLTASFIIEEGFSIAELQRIAASMGTAAKEAGVEIVAGDTKVVEQGKGDGLFITTSGIGKVLARKPPLPARVRAGDAVLISGDLGRHGAAILAAREELSLQSDIVSDCACLVKPVLALIDQGIDVHCLRDLTRGGLAAAANEISQSANVGMVLREEEIPISPGVLGACEILGLDPLIMANEGRFMVILPEKHVQQALGILKSFPVSESARLIGECRSDSALVSLKTAFGTERILDMPSGDLLPRIC